jgi:uncharacterized membrane protein YedE/YeeE
MQEASLATPVPRTRALPQVPRWASLGILFGLLSAAAIALYGPIGVSGTYPRFVGAVLRRTTPDFAKHNTYLEKMGSLVTPESLLVVGLLIGGFLAAMISRSHAPKLENINRGETTSTRRYLNTFIGGFLIIFGARLAGGCTSGHIISGMTQLSVSAFIFAAGVFGAGMVTAKLMKGAN